MHHVFVFLLLHLLPLHYIIFRRLHISFAVLRVAYKYMQRDTVSSLIGPVINEIPIFFSFFIYCIAIEWKYHINMYIEDYLILLYYIFFARLCIFVMTYAEWSILKINLILFSFCSSERKLNAINIDEIFVCINVAVINLHVIYELYIIWYEKV